jgi:hypothetical protein
MAVDKLVEKTVAEETDGGAATMSRTRMGDLLVERGVLTQGQLEECLALQRNSPAKATLRRTT